MSEKSAGRSGSDNSARRKLFRSDRAGPGGGGAKTRPPGRIAHSYEKNFPGSFPAHLPFVKRRFNLTVSALTDMGSAHDGPLLDSLRKPLGRPLVR
jgi:hypothetical protein